MAKCRRAQHAVLRSVREFGDNYFYDLNLNLKLCRGIKRAQKEKTFQNGYTKTALALFYYWASEDCSKAAYTRIERNITTTMHGGLQLEFQKLFPGKINPNAYPEINPT